MRLKPTGKAALPVGFFPLPAGFSPKPVGNVSLPVGFSPKPAGTVSLPAGFVPLPAGFVSLPAGKAPLPVGFVSLPAGTVSLPAGFVSSPPGAAWVGRSAAAGCAAVSPRGVPPGRSALLREPPESAEALTKSPAAASQGIGQLGFRGEERSK